MPARLDERMKGEICQRGARPGLRDDSREQGQGR